jgi:hypothetical protein
MPFVAAPKSNYLFAQCSRENLVNEVKQEDINNGNGNFYFIHQASRSFAP